MAPPPPPPVAAPLEPPEAPPLEVPPLEPPETEAPDVEAEAVGEAVDEFVLVLVLVVVGGGTDGVDAPPVGTVSCGLKLGPVPVDPPPPHAAIRAAHARLATTPARARAAFRRWFTDPRNPAQPTGPTFRAVAFACRRPGNR